MPRKIKEEIDFKANEGYSAGTATVTVYPPIVTVRNNIFPPYEELQNCTTCSRGRQLPADKLTNADYHYRCTWDLQEHIGVDMKHLDNDCDNFNRKRSDKK
jgi:hypothetical protein